jgi:hypothetical protein
MGVRAVSLSRNHRSRPGPPVALRTLGLVGLLSGIIVFHQSAAGAQETPSRCPPSESTTPPQQENSAPSGRLVSEKDKVEIPFGTDRRPKSREIPLKVEGGVTVHGEDLRGVIRGDILREDRAATLPKRGQISVTPLVEAGLLTVELCVDIARPEEAEPGTYQGSILILGPPGLEPATIPLVVTVSESGWWKPSLAALFAALAALGVKAARDLFKREELQRGKLKRYILSVQFLAQSLAGITLAGGVYWRTYLESSNFGSGWGDYRGLMAASFAAVLTGSIFGDLGVGVARRATGHGDATDDETGAGAASR